MNNPLSPGSVAVVDDDAAVRRALQRLLSAGGYRSDAFASAEHYLEHAGRHGHAGCLLLDIELPAMSGLELQTILAEEPCMPPIVFLSGRSDVPALAQAYGFGCVAFLHKPVKAATLFAALDVAWGLA